jgi:hypothetical protein
MVTFRRNISFPSSLRKSKPNKIPTIVQAKSRVLSKTLKMEVYVLRKRRSLSELDRGVAQKTRLFIVTAVST